MCDPELIKRCGTCKEYKSTEEFNKERRASNGLNCSCRDCRKRITKEWRIKKLKGGGCPYCGGPRVENKTLCEPCLQTQKIRTAILYTRNKKEGLCVRCGKINLCKTVHCEDCKEIISKQKKDNYIKQYLEEINYVDE